MKTLTVDSEELEFGDSRGAAELVASPGSELWCRNWPVFSSGSYLSVGFIFHCFHLLSLGLWATLPFISFSPQGPNFVPLMNLPPEG